MPPNNLYFIALIPPEDIQKDVINLKMHFKEQYNSKKALTSPPHVTLFPPFQCDQVDYLKEILEKVAANMEPVEVYQDGFGSFPPKVIYINVEKSEELQAIHEKVVQALANELDIPNDRYGDKPYSPHMTLATKDLTKENFKKAWPKFKDQPFQARWTADAISLLKHNGKYWEVLEEFMLG